MLIPTQTILKHLKQHEIVVNGGFHIGAHECEELSFYKQLGLSDKQIIWIDALQNKVDEAKAKGIPNVYQAVITDKDDEPVTFHITNNVQSSSILDFGSHSKHHPTVKFINEIDLKTTTIDTFFERNNINSSNYDFWNFDIQGAELLALKGALKSLHIPKVIYLEVNVEEVYKGCALMSEIDDFLKEYGFRRVETNITNCGWGDALYIRSGR